MANFKTYDILVHICCSVDSHFFLKQLQKQRPHESIVGFFYDPNIHPYSEYYLRYLDVKRSCEILGIDLIIGEYDVENWLLMAKGYENEPEKGKRCSLCFDKRLEVSMKQAKQMNIGKVTTTLLTSPKKSIDQLYRSATNLAQKYDVEFLLYDFKKGGGTQKQFKMAKDDMLYHQDYCGCIYALKDQRESMKKYADELISDISNTILPESIDYRVWLYKKRDLYEKQGVLYKITREKFLNYRLQRAYVRQNGDIVVSYFLYFSNMKKEYLKSTKVEYKIDDVYYLNRENIKLIDIDTYNKLTLKNYTNTKELIYSSKDINDDFLVRKVLDCYPYGLSPIIVLDKICEKSKYSIYCKAVVYEDVIENLVKI